MRRWPCWSRDRHADGGAGRAQKPDAAERQRYMAKALLPIVDGGRGFSCAERRIFDGYLYQRRTLQCDKQTGTLAGGFMRQRALRRRKEIIHNRDRMFLTNA